MKGRNRAGLKKAGRNRAGLKKAVSLKAEYISLCEETSWDTFILHGLLGYIGEVTGIKVKEDGRDYWDAFKLRVSEFASAEVSQIEALKEQRDEMQGQINSLKIELAELETSRYWRDHKQVVEEIIAAKPADAE